MSKQAEELQQDRRDREYREAWDRAPKSFLAAAAKAGIEPKLDPTSKAIEYKETFITASYTPDMSDLDTYVDMLIEEIGIEHAKVIKMVASRMEKKLEEEIKRNRAATIGRVVMYLVRGGRVNIEAKIHSLIHAIPRLAEANGFPSMNASATKCGVSREWIRRGRDQCCEILGIPIPCEGTKPKEVKEKLREAATRDHWTRRKYGQDENLQKPHQLKDTTND